MSEHARSLDTYNDRWLSREEAMLDHEEDGAVCETCWGEGSGEENELMSDWVNYGSAWVLCPDCRGTGRVA